MSASTKGTYCFGEFQLNLDLRFLARQGQRVALGPKAYEVLTCLVSRAGTVVSKNDLLKEVWVESYVEEGTLVQHVFSLRRALGDKADYIVTVPGQGYLFEGTVQHFLPEPGRAGPHSGDGVVHEMRERTHVVVEEPMLSKLASKPWPGMRIVLMAVVIVLAAGGSAGWVWSRRTAPRDHVSVVLSDFMNTTEDSTFDRTLGRALNIDLSQSPFLDVMSEREGVETLRLMGQRGDAPLTLAIAREVCERANKQVVLTGDIASIGDQYLITLQAADCHTGKALASAQARAVSKAKVLDALDSVAEKVRSKLGESSQSIGSFDVPLQRATTPSLDALRAYSIGKHVQAQADGFTASLPFFQRAVELDPQFAQAYAELAVTYYNLSEPRLEAEYMKKAYDLRDRVGAPDRLAFEAHYLDGVLNDMPAAIKVYEEWSNTYPRDWVPWLDAANLHQQLGQYDAAITSGRRALALDRSVLCYIVLARSLKSANRFAEARTLGQEAIQSGKDSGPLRSILLEVAFDQQDATAFAQESQAMANFKDDYRSYFLAKAASMNGKIAQSQELFDREIASEKQEGLVESADSVAIEQAQAEREIGLPAVARKTLDTVAKASKATPEYAVERAKLGDISFAERFLAEHRNDPHPGTDLAYQQLPEIRAALALARKKPLDAIAALQDPRPYGVDSLTTLMLRGEAYLEAGQFEKAAAQYKEIIANPGRGFDVEDTLAHLGLARSCAGAGDRVNARAEYRKFLVLWKDADPNVPVLVAAKSESARLR
jgi:DNA-binding winged helix-turn-helix (wHTH) protein/tetratricopeptide (TPR) repeat protein